MKKTLLFFLIIQLFYSCSVFDKEEALPSFIKIDSVDVLSDIQTEGSNSYNITEVQVLINGSSLGYFNIPSVIPVLATGDVEVGIRAIVKQDGVSSTRVQYPFYTLYTVPEVLNELDTVLISPEFNYFENLEFWLQEFQTSNAFISGTNSEGEMGLINEPGVSLEGSSGQVVLDEGADYFILETDEEFEWPVGQAVFLEMDYACNGGFFVGTEAIQSNLTLGIDDLVGINATFSGNVPVWNKIYINLTDFIANNATADHFEFFLRGFTDSNISPEYYFDNIKIIHF